MNDQALVENRIRALADNRGWLIALGAVLIVLGSLAILVPPAAALAVNLLLGWLLVIGGVALCVHAFRARAWGGLATELAMGLVYLLVGVLLLVYPLEGILTLTLLLAALLIAGGVLRTAAALRLRPATGWGWLLTSGILSLVLGVMIALSWPSAAPWVLGLLVGIELIFDGWALIMLGNFAHRTWHSTASGTA